MKLHQWLGSVVVLERLEDRIDTRDIITRTVYERWRTLVDEASEIPSPCRAPVCTAERREVVRRMTTNVASRIRDVGYEFSSVRELQLKYADLRESGTPAWITNVSVRADTYHNCKFRSRSRWRSLNVGTWADLGRLYGYCARGVDWCDTLFTRSASGTRVSKALDPLLCCLAETALSPSTWRSPPNRFRQHKNRFTVISKICTTSTSVRSPRPASSFTSSSLNSLLWFLRFATAPGFEDNHLFGHPLGWRRPILAT